MRRGYVLAWLLASSWSCAGDLKDPDRFDFVVHHDGGAGTSDASAPDAGPPDCLLMLFSKTCGVAGCHAAGTNQIDLVSDGLVGRLVDQLAPDNPMSKCQGKTLVSSTGGSSLLVDKLTSSPPCGVPMPLGLSATTDQKKCVSDWVASLQKKSGGK